MKLLRILFLGLAMLPALACAQWQWIDKDGRKVFSDRSPPADIPARNILKQPGGKPPPPPAEAEPPNSAASSPAVVAKPVANLTKISGKDKALEDKKKDAQLEEEAKKKAADEKFAKEKADNCDRARRALLTLNSGTRIRAPNAKGEMEILTDEQRAVETKRLQGITANCKS